MIYSCPTYKCLLQPEAPRRLAELEEARGQLLRIFTAEEMCIATFEWGIMGLPLEIGEELKLLVGREIAILRLDGQYHIREVVEGA